MITFLPVRKVCLWKEGVICNGQWATLSAAATDWYGPMANGSESAILIWGDASSKQQQFGKFGKESFEVWGHRVQPDCGLISLQEWLCSLRSEDKTRVCRWKSNRQHRQRQKHTPRIKTKKNECFVHFLFTELSIGGSTSTCNVFNNLSLMQCLQKHVRWICVFLFAQGWLDADGCLGMAWVLILNVTVRETQKFGWR